MADGDTGIHFEQVNAVDTSWRAVQAIPNYEVVAGTLLFQKIFELAPGALGMYSFGPRFENPSEEKDGGSTIHEDLYTSPLFIRHAKGVVCVCVLRNQGSHGWRQ